MYVDLKVTIVVCSLFNERSETESICLCLRSFTGYRVALGDMSSFKAINYVKLQF